MNKKLIVSGCANCPYLIVWNDGKENGLDSISSGECRHPSFNKLLPGVHMSPSVFLSYDVEGRPDGTAKARFTPTWCPLPNDNEE